MRPRIYIAGPMTGYEYYNYTAFHLAKNELEYLGYDVINPHEEDKKLGFDVLALPVTHNWDSLPPGFQTINEIALRCIETVHVCDAVFCLQGHQNSKGARAEIAYAKWLGLPVYSDLCETPSIDQWEEVQS